MKEIKVAYRVENGGDGSAHPLFYVTETEAEAAEKQDFEEGYDGWAEPSVGTLHIYMKEGCGPAENGFYIRGEREFFPETKSFGPYPYYKLEISDV